MLSIKFVGASVKLKEGFWKTEITPLSKGIAKLSQEGVSLKLAQSVSVNDKFVYTSEKVN